MKRIGVFLLCTLFVITNIPCAFGSVFPSAFWPVNSNYENALATQNYYDIINFGTQEIEIVNAIADCTEKRDVLISRYSEIANAYAKIKDYGNSAYAYSMLYNCAMAFGDKYIEYAKAAKAYALQYTPQIEMYTDNGQAPYFGAKNEKSNGVLFGLCANGETRSKLDNESMVLVYQEFGQPLLPYNTNVVSKASAMGIAVEFALNCPNEADDIYNTTSKTSYLKEISDMLNNYPNVPVFLRFAAEFDAWQNLADVESFKTSFRYVSQYFKDRNPNVAIVWSPNQVSNWNINADDFYPGDEYVDWVGVSLYAQKYFFGNKNAPEKDEVIFRTGVNSDPVLAVKDLVEKYGNRKPIMLSESGCGHKVVYDGEDTTEFAIQRLKEYLTYLPMVYPQIKLMGYFDWYVNAQTEKNYFRLSSNAKLQNEYLKLTKGERFIQNAYGNETDFCYRPINNGTGVNSIFPVSCYAHSYDDETKSVTYFIDGNYVGMSNELPFTTYVNASGYYGNHTLKAVATLASGKTIATESAIDIYNSNDGDISVKISNQNVEFDQKPVLYNDRTMVPMRKIFEELGAMVSWDNDTQTASGKTANTTVKITVGSKKMYVNNKEVTLDTPAIVLSDRTLVPVRAIAEGLGCNVGWDDSTKTVFIEPANAR